MRDQRDFRRDAEATYVRRAGDRDIGDFLGAWIISDMRVGEEKRAALRDDQRQRRAIVESRRKPDNVLDVPKTRLKAPVEAADQRVGFAALDRKRPDHRRIGPD